METMSILSTMNRRALFSPARSMSNWGLLPLRRALGHFLIVTTVLIGIIMAVIGNLAAAKAGTNCHYPCPPPPPQSRSKLNGYVWGMASVLLYARSSFVVYTKGILTYSVVVSTSSLDSNLVLIYLLFDVNDKQTR